MAAAAAMVTASFRMVVGTIGVRSWVLSGFRLASDRSVGDDL